MTPQKNTTRKHTASPKIYVDRNLARKYAHWRIIDGKHFFEVAPGMWMHGIFFDKYFPKYELKRDVNG